VSAARNGTIIHSFSRTGRQQMKTMRPPWRTARLRLAKAGAGSAKNMTPKREMTASAPPGGKAETAASSTRNCAASPSAAARSRARATIGSEMSTPSAAPPDPTRRIASSVVSPQPQPMSMTRSPGCSAAAAKRGSEAGLRTRSCSSWRRTQFAPLAPFQSVSCLEAYSAILDMNYFQAGEARGLPFSTT
jgi:hypothetical protein